MIILTDLLPPAKSKALIQLAAQRAKLLEIIASSSSHSNLTDSLSLLGLFSLLEGFLDMSFKQLLPPLPISDTIKDALIDQSGPLAPWLELIECIENSQWEKLGELSYALKIPEGAIAKAYRSSCQWADAFFESVRA